MKSELDGEIPGGFETVRRGNANTLRVVIPIAEKREVGGITVALSALEIYEDGGGILRYLISYDPRTVFADRFRGSPEPEIEVRDGSGRSYGGAPHNRQDPAEPVG